MSFNLSTMAGDGASFDAHPDFAIYRYRLWRQLNRVVPERRVLFVMLNPSTASHSVPDPTITRCIGFARGFGFDRLDVVNLYAFRATIPEQLDTFIGGIVGSENDEQIARAAKESAAVICAWGAKIPKQECGRAQEVLKILRDAGHPTLYCLGETKAGHPKHPLYLKGTTPLEVYAK